MVALHVVAGQGAEDRLIAPAGGVTGGRAAECDVVGAFLVGTEAVEIVGEEIDLSIERVEERVIGGDHRSGIGNGRLRVGGVVGQDETFEDVALIVDLGIDGDELRQGERTMVDVVEAGVEPVEGHVRRAGLGVDVVRGVVEGDVVAGEIGELVAIDGDEGACRAAALNVESVDTVDPLVVDEIEDLIGSAVEVTVHIGGIRDDVVLQGGDATRGGDIDAVVAVGDGVALNEEIAFGAVGIDADVDIGDAVVEHLRACAGVEEENTRRVGAGEEAVDVGERVVLDETGRAFEDDDAVGGGPDLIFVIERVVGDVVGEARAAQGDALFLELGDVRVENIEVIAAGIHGGENAEAVLRSGGGPFVDVFDRDVVDRAARVVVADAGEAVVEEVGGDTEAIDGEVLDVHRTGVVDLDDGVVGSTVAGVDEGVGEGRGGNLNHRGGSHAI